MSEFGAAFWKWFGKSKIVDAAGAPLVVYRGDADDFSKFDRGETNENGFFFTPDREIAKIYAGKGNEPRAYYLSARRVLNLVEDTPASRKWVARWSKNYEEWTDRRSGEPMDAFDVIQGGQLFDYEGTWSSERWRDLQASAEDDGYDAVILPDYDNDKGVFTSIVVFRPEQIKAIDNDGTWDAGDPDIRSNPPPSVTQELEDALEQAMAASRMRHFGLRVEGRRVRVGDILGNSFHSREYLQDLERDDPDGMSGTDTSRDMELDGTLAFHVDYGRLKSAMGYLWSEFMYWQPEAGVVLIGSRERGRMPEIGVPEEGAVLLREPVVLAIIKDFGISSNPPVLESDDLIAAVRAGIQKAVRERPGRMTHGNTGKNAFVIVGDRIYAYNEYDGGWRRSGGVSVHSHSGDNWRGAVREDEKAIRAYMDQMYRDHMHEGERKQPLNSADILAFVTGLKNGDLSATALLYYDGVFELLAPNAKAEPERLAALLRLKRKDFEKLLDVPYAEASKAWDESKTPVETLDRERVRAFAKRFGLLYLEDQRWA